MDQKNQFARSRWRALAGLVCLLAVGLMQAPLVLATWSLSTGMCCTGNYCPIAAHHHKKAASEPAHEMDCGHGMSGVTRCTMSCCHDTDQPKIAASMFVMPPAASFRLPTDVLATVEAPKPTEFVRSTEPLSPPPRNISSVL